jgi:anthranilate phosphoribosyltransferase
VQKGKVLIKSVLRRIVEGDDLSQEEARQAMSELMEGKATQAQIGALLAALRLKRETVDELTGFARAMREHSIEVHPTRSPLLDTCGTGGDIQNTFNISTVSAFVLAGAGVAIAKHGGRAVSSKCGSADVLSALGVRLDISPELTERCIDEVGLGFLFAPHHHPAMKYAAQPRSELGIRTVFNILGPLTNPACALRQIIGVYHPDLCELMASTLRNLGCEKAMVVHGMAGLDEISTVGSTQISFLKEGRIHTETFNPADFGIAEARLQDIEGGETLEQNAAIMQELLEGKPGPKQDIVCLNAAAGFILTDYVTEWRDGINLARETILSGKALQTLHKLVEFTSISEPAQKSKLK